MSAEAQIEVNKRWLESREQIEALMKRVSCILCGHYSKTEMEDDAIRRPYERDGKYQLDDGNNWFASITPQNNLSIRWRYGGGGNSEKFDATIAFLRHWLI